MGTPISERLKEVNSRKTFEHWELDTMVSNRGESKRCFATFVERKSRLYTAFKIPDRTSESMKNAIVQLFRTLQCWQTVKDELNLPLYFADPYSSWQRGSNENSNGLLREFLDHENV